MIESHARSESDSTRSSSACSASACGSADSPSRSDRPPRGSWEPGEIPHYHVLPGPCQADSEEAESSRGRRRATLMGSARHDIRPSALPARLRVRLSGVIPRERRDFALRRLLALADVVAVTGALAIAMTQFGYPAYKDVNTTERLGWSLLALPFWILVFKSYGLYDRDSKRVSHSTVDELPRLFHAVVIGGLGLWVFFSSSRRGPVLRRGRGVLRACAALPLSCARGGADAREGRAPAGAHPLPRRWTDGGAPDRQDPLASRVQARADRVHRHPRGVGRVARARAAVPRQSRRAGADLQARRGRPRGGARSRGRCGCARRTDQKDGGARHPDQRPAAHRSTRSGLPSRSTTSRASPCSVSTRRR